MLDVCNSRGADIDSDQMLMVTELHLKVANARRLSDYGRVGRRYDVRKLRLSLQGMICAAFALEVDSDTVDPKWNRIKVAYYEARSVNK